MKRVRYPLLALCMSLAVFTVAFALSGARSLRASEPAAQKPAATVDPSDLPPDDPGDVEYVSKCFPNRLIQTDGAGNQVALGLATNLSLDSDKLVGNKALQQAISRLHFIQYVSSSGTTGDDLLLAAMALWPAGNLKTTSLCADVGDDALANLERFQGLEQISLESDRITDAAFPHLGKLRNLNLLFVSSQRPNNRNYRLKITGSGLTALASLKKLRELSVLDCPIDDAGVRNLKGMTLVRFDLRYPDISDRGVEAIGDMATLEHLTICHTTFTDNGLSHLAKLAKLRLLAVVDDPKITGRELKSLSALKNLKTLCLIACPIDDSAVKSIKGMRLKVLNLCLTQITDKALDEIKDMTTLEELYVGDTKVTKAAIIRLKAAKSLKINDYPVDRKQFGLEEGKK